MKKTLSGNRIYSTKEKSERSKRPIKKDLNIDLKKLKTQKYVVYVYQPVTKGKERGVVCPTNERGVQIRDLTPSAPRFNSFSTLPTAIEKAMKQRRDYLGRMAFGEELSKNDRESN